MARHGGEGVPVACSPPPHCGRGGRLCPSASRAGSGSWAARWDGRGKETELGKPRVARSDRVLVAEKRPADMSVVVERGLCQGPRRDGMALVATQKTTESCWMEE